MNKDKTKEVIKKMLLEDTGRALCDSGGIPEFDKNGKFVRSTQGYGRHFERNRNRDFEKEPAVFVRFGPRELEATINVYHFMSERLTLDEELQKKFEEWCGLEENEDLCWLEAAEKFVREVIKPDECGVEYTYNNENALSQDLHYVYWYDRENHQDMVLLSTHNGCDARGGFSKPHAFELHDGYLWGRDLYMYCNREKPSKDQGILLESPDNLWEPHRWMTENAGYRWHGENNDIQIGYDSDSLSDNPEDRGKGKIFYDEEGAGYCPICGSELEVYF